MKQNKQRSTVKSIIFGVVILLLLFALFGSCGADEVVQEPVEAEKKVEQPVEDKEAKEKEEQARIAEQQAKDQKAKEEAEAEAKANSDEQAELEQAALLLIEDSFTGVATIEFDKENKSYLITSTDPAFMQAVVMISDGQMPMDDWYMILDSMSYLSKSVQELLGNGYSVVMVNPSNTERVLVIVQDGIVMYDAMEEAI